jgi:hypothetical protein
MRDREASSVWSSGSQSLSISEFSILLSHRLVSVNRESRMQILRGAIVKRRIGVERVNISFEARLVT